MAKDTREMKYVILANSNNGINGLPRQLIEINGEPLIGRTVRLLKQNGVKDIVITAHDKRFYNFGVPVHNPINSDYDYKTGSGYWLNAFPFELLDKPVCFIWGDVYFSEYAIKTIVETPTDSTLFFCAFENHNPKYIKDWDEPLAYKVIDTKLFKDSITKAKKMYDEKVTWRNPIVWELYRVIHGQNINVHEMTTDYIAINDESCDIDNIGDIIRLNIKLGGIEVVKVEVIKPFTLGRFDEITNIVRKGQDIRGQLNIGDVFECTNELAEYLTGNNDKGVVVVKLLEVIPEKEEVKEVLKELSTLDTINEVKKPIKKPIKKKNK